MPVVSGCNFFFVAAFVAAFEIPPVRLLSHYLVFPPVWWLFLFFFFSVGGKNPLGLRAQLSMHVFPRVYFSQQCNLCRTTKLAGTLFSSTRTPEEKHNHIYKEE